MKLSWTQPVCESCWINQESTWRDGTLVDVRIPARVSDSAVHQCAWCGQATIFGVFKRADPTLLPYPATEDE